ncbi:MAG: glycoside hydrolase family 2 protein, partial [Candidatus Caldatribacteriaceae bacterium]
WWPNGLGEPHLYKVVLLLLREDGEELDRFEKLWGIREISLRQEPLSKDEGESFTILVNGEPIFCKGADWVPADSFIPRVTKEKYAKLIDEAKEAHFNMFRIWGGGVYEDPFFYEHCARRGIMVWQDFMFACAYYPKDPAFFREVEREIEVVVKNLRNETAIVLWCGNNELQWLHERNREISGRNDLEFSDYEIYHSIMPRLLRELDPTRPFWLSSPYGGKDPNSELEGDRHAWYVSILGEDSRERINYENYAKDRGKFISEFGVLAPPSFSSLSEFIPPGELYINSPSWQFHNCTFERGNIGEMLREFVKNPEELSFQEYLHYAQLLQGEALKLAIENWRRRKFLTSGTLFWMYSDCWGAIGWTIIDYYLRRKASYYFVRRAFQPVDLSVRKNEVSAEIFVVNDTRSYKSLSVAYGLSLFDGTSLFSGNESFRIAPNVSERIVNVHLAPIQGREKESFLWVILYDGNTITDWERCFFVRFKDLNLPKAHVLSRLITDRGTRFLELESQTFAWSVHIELPPGFLLEDNYFDLFPRTKRRVRVEGEGTLEIEDVRISWNNV